MRSVTRMMNSVSKDPDTCCCCCCGQGIHPHYFILVAVTSLVLLLLAVQKLQHSGPPVLSPCPSKNDSYLSYLESLQSTYFPSPTIPAFPKAEYRQILMGNNYIDVAPWFSASPPSEHCRQYQHELTQCAWATVRDVTDAAMGADDHVTLVTVALWDRIARFLELLNYWKGPVSVSLYVDEEDVEQCMQKLSRVLRGNVYVTLVVKNGLHFPLNMLRNLAAVGCRTECGFLLDEGYIPSTDTEHSLINSCRTLNAYHVLVVPAFSFTSPHRHTDAGVLQGKSRLLQTLHETDTVQMEQASIGVNLFRWKTSDAKYQVPYSMDFKPFVLLHNTMIGWHPEVFMGDTHPYSFHLNLVANGLNYHSLPNSYVVNMQPVDEEDSAIYKQCSDVVWSSWKESYQYTYNVDINNFAHSSAESISHCGLHSIAAGLLIGAARIVLW